MRAFAATLAGACALVSFSQADASGEVKALRLYNIHTHEKAVIVFKHGDVYDRDGLKKINLFLRDWRRELPTRMDPHLLDLIWEVYRESGSHDYIHVVCGYRSPPTNAMLRRRSSGVAKNSMHMQGRALDFYIPDVPLAKLRAIGLRMQEGGVGFYPTSGAPFVHMDTGRVRHWPRMSRQQLVRVFPNGRTLHIPSDGRPLPGYQQALAAYRARMASETSTAGLYPSTPGPDASLKVAQVMKANVGSVDFKTSGDTERSDTKQIAWAKPMTMPPASALPPAATKPAQAVGVAVASYASAPPPLPRLAPNRQPIVVAAAAAPVPQPAPAQPRVTKVAAPIPVVTARLEPAADAVPPEPVSRDFDAAENWSAPAVPADLAQAMAKRDISRPASMPIAPTAVVATIDVNRPLRADAITKAVLRRDENDAELATVPTVMAFAPPSAPLTVGRTASHADTALGVPIPPPNPMRGHVRLALASAPANVPAASPATVLTRRALGTGLTLTALDTLGLRQWIASDSTRQKRYALLTMPDFAAIPALFDKPEVSYSAGFSLTAYAGLRTDHFDGALVKTPGLVELDTPKSLFAAR